MKAFYLIKEMNEEEFNYLSEKVKEVVGEAFEMLEYIDGLALLYVASDVREEQKAKLAELGFSDAEEEQ